MKRRALTDLDWAMVEHYARHGSQKETAAVFGVKPRVVERRIRRIAPVLIGAMQARRLGGAGLRIATELRWGGCDGQLAIDAQLGGMPA